MKNKILSEQDSNQKSKILRDSISLGCFKNLNFSAIDDKPTLVDNEIILKATGKTSEQLYYIYAEPKILFNTVTKKKMKWECSELDKKTEQGKSSEPKTTEKSSVVTTQEKPIETPPSETDIKTNIENLKKALEIKKIDTKICRDAILTFHDGLEKSKQKLKTISGTDFEKVKEVVQMCSRQKNIWNKLPLVGDRLEKKLNDLKNVDASDTIIGKFKILENENLTKIVKEKIKETKISKENKKIQEDLFKVRLKLVLENLDEFEKLQIGKKVKTSFKILREMSVSNKMGLLNENLGSLFRGIYGKSFETSINTISEPLFNVILTKILLEDSLKSKVLENISSKTSELISSMEDCTTLSKFLTDVILEEYAKHLDEEKTKNNSLVYTSFMDSVDDEMFRKNLNTKLESVVCVLYNKFTENAKNLMVRMSAL